MSLTRGGTLCHHEPPRRTELTCTTRRSWSSTPRCSATAAIWRTTGRSPSSSTRSAIPTGYRPWWPRGKAAHTRPPATVLYRIGWYVLGAHLKLQHSHAHRLGDMAYFSGQRGACPLNPGG